MNSGDLATVEQALAEVARDRAELAHLRAQHDAAVAATTATSAARDEAARTRAAEAADVESLESWSPTRIWAGIRGNRDVELSREQAELQAADYTLAAAEQRHASAVAQAEQIAASIGALGDVEARYTQALADKERLLVASEIGAAGELVEIAERRGALDAERKELEEADAAGRDAEIYLDRAVQLLQSASSWATFDTFGGGGLFTDAMKYDKMDKAAAALRGADARLRTLRVELADVDLTGVPEMQVANLTRTFDIWFDNIFSDWSVRSRIGDALKGAIDARHSVRQVSGVLAGRKSETESEAERLVARRAELLSGSAGSAEAEPQWQQWESR